VEEIKSLHSCLGSVKLDMYVKKGSFLLHLLDTCANTRHEASCSDFFSKQQEAPLTESGLQHRPSSFLTQKKTMPPWTHDFTYAFRFGPPELRLPNCLTYFPSL